MKCYLCDVRQVDDFSTCRTASQILFEQLEELLVGKAGAFDDPQCQPTTQIAAVPGYDHTGTVAGAPQNNVKVEIAQGEP